MSTLAVVEEILRETAVPMSVREVVERAGSRLPSKSKTPDTVVARDLSMDIKKRGDGSIFMRTSPGRYTLRELVLRGVVPSASVQASNGVPTAVPNVPDGMPVMAAMRGDRSGPLSVRPASPADGRQTASTR
jgi:HB1, ASXL, restriction endonuclease HTH domain